MPPPEVIQCKQTAVLWPCTGYDSSGMPLHSAPVELKPPNGVRWLDKQSTVLDAQGNTIGVDGSAVVLQDVAVDSLLWLGALNSWYGVGSVGSPSGLMVVKAFNKTPDLKARKYRRTVMFMRYMDKPG